MLKEDTFEFKVSYFWGRSTKTERQSRPIFSLIFSCRRPYVTKNTWHSPEVSRSYQWPLMLLLRLSLLLSILLPCRRRRARGPLLRTFPPSSGGASPSTSVSGSGNFSTVNFLPDVDSSTTDLVALVLSGDDVLSEDGLWLEEDSDGLLSLVNWGITWPNPGLSLVDWGELPWTVW